MRLRPPLFLLPLLALLACGSSGTGTPTNGPPATQSLFVVPASLADLSDVHFYDHPFPSDFRRDPDGSVHFGGFYNPYGTTIIDSYVQATVGLLQGFSPVAAAYLRFTGDLDPSTLPATPQAGLDPHASVQLVDVDPGSPERGQRKLAQIFWRQADGVYWLHDTLAVMPALGYPLRPRTQYAVVVTSDVHDTMGHPVAPSSDLAEVLGTPSARTKPVHDLFAPAVAELAKDGVPTSAIAHLTVFTTNDPTAQLFAVRDDVRANVLAPTVDPASWMQMETTADYDVYQGVYSPSPNYQAGTIPFAQYGDGGNFVFDAGGKPMLQNTFPMRFTFVVPNVTRCPPPAAGYPMVLYAHGTGGDYRSIVDEQNSVGQALAQQCVASMGVDQIFHGTRPGAPPLDDPNRVSTIELLFFNLNNPIAARTNGQQSAVDVVQQARLFTDSHVGVPASLSRTGVAIAFDATKLGFFGHSQGGLNGPLFMAADDQVHGGVLSGSSSMITIALLEKTQPSPSVAAAVITLLRLTHPGEAAELNVFHPVMNLAESIIDTTDPINYVGSIIQHPRAGFAPKSIYQTEGVNPDGTGDSYAPPHGIEVESVALGLPREAPGIHPIAEAAFSGLGDVTIPAGGLSGNLAGGMATGVLGQFVPAPGDDGHFVVFDVPACRLQAAEFCRDLMDHPVGLVSPVM